MPAASARASAYSMAALMKGSAARAAAGSSREYHARSAGSTLADAGRAGADAREPMRVGAIQARRPPSGKRVPGARRREYRRNYRRPARNMRRALHSRHLRRHRAS